MIIQLILQNTYWKRSLTRQLSIKNSFFSTSSPSPSPPPPPLLLLLPILLLLLLLLHLLIIIIIIIIIRLRMTIIQNQRCSTFLAFKKMSVVSPNLSDHWADVRFLFHRTSCWFNTIITAKSVVAMSAADVVTLLPFILDTILSMWARKIILFLYFYFFT